jgi:hypothetical protein
MKIEINTVHTFKFNSGEEVIAKVMSFEHPWITVTEPVAVAPGPQGMGLIPALFTADHGEDILINVNNCAFVARTDDAVTTKYIQATTGLTVPDKKIVMG